MLVSVEHPSKACCLVPVLTWDTVSEGGRGVSLLTAAAVSDAGEELSDLQSKPADIIYNCWAGSSQIKKIMM